MPATREAPTSSVEAKQAEAGGPLSAAAAPAASSSGARDSLGGGRVRAQTEAAVARDTDLELAGLKRPRASIPIVAWVAVAAALIFGVVIGLTLKSSDPTSTASAAPGPTLAVPTSASATESATAADLVGGDGELSAQGSGEPAHPTSDEAASKSAGLAQALSAAEATVDELAVGKGQGTALGASETGDEAESGDSKAGLGGLKGLSGLRTDGPSAAPSTSGASGPKQPLDAAAVTRTVGRYRKSVSRSCWQRLAGAAGPDAPSSARVTVTISVSPTGTVSGVSSTGDPRGYPGLARCIESRVRGWQFPAPGEATTVNVPFVFAAQ